MYIKILSTSLLLLFFSTANVIAQHSDKSISFGLNAAYTSEHGVPGMGINVQKQISPRFEIGVKGDFYIPEDRRQTGFNMTREFEQRMVFGSIFGQINIISTTLLNIYGTAGLVHQRISYDGEMNVFNDTPPYQTYTYDLKFTQKNTGVEIGSGMEFGNRFTFFVEPAIALLDKFQFNLSTGLRLRL